METLYLLVGFLVGVLFAALYGENEDDNDA